MTGTLFDHNLQFDYLINNAGVTMNKRFEEVTEEEYDQIMSINAKGPFDRFGKSFFGISKMPTAIKF